MCIYVYVFFCAQQFFQAGNKCQNDMCLVQIKGFFFFFFFLSLGLVSSETTSE